MTALDSDLPVIVPAGATRVPLPVRLGLLVGSAGSGAAAQVITVLAMRFFTDNLAVAAGVAAAIFAINRIYDGVIDPYVGHVSDRTQSRWGRRLPFLLLSAFLLPMSVAAVFNMPQLSSQLAMGGLITGVLLLYATAHTLWAVPYLALSVEVSTDYHERSSIMAWKAYGGTAGIMLGSTMPAWLIAHFGADAAGHGRMGLIVAGVVLVLLVSATLLMSRTRHISGVAGDHRILRQMAIAWANKPFRILAIVHICFHFGTATVSASNAYFSRDVLHASDVWLGTFYIILLAGNVVAVPLWLMASRRFEKRGTYMVSLTIYGLLILTWLLAGPSELYAVRVARVFFTGMAMGGVVLLGASTLSDAIRYDFVKTGLGREGAFSGAMSLIDKFSAAAGVACLGWILSLAGYAAGAANYGAGASPSVRLALYAGFAIIPAATALISVLLLIRYPLTKADFDSDRTAP